MRRLDRFRRFRGRLPLLSPHPIVTEIDGGLIQAPYHPRRTIEDFELDSFDVDGHEITDRYVCEDHSRMKKGLKEMSNILAREALKTYRDYYGTRPYEFVSVHKTAIQVYRLDYYLTFGAKPTDGNYDENNVAKTKTFQAIVNHDGVRTFVEYVRIIPST